MWELLLCCSYCLLCCSCCFMRYCGTRLLAAFLCVLHRWQLLLGRCPCRIWQSNIAVTSNCLAALAYGGYKANLMFLVA